MSLYHAFRQDNGKGWGILRQLAPGSTEAVVLAVDLPEHVAKAGLAEMRAGDGNEHVRSPKP